MTSIETVKETIGQPCNPYMVGTFEAVDQMNQRLKWAGIDDWKAGWSHHVNAMPEDAIRVGQVKVHHGDQPYPLWVKQTYREPRDYAVDFTLTIAETVTVTAPSLEEAQEIVNDLGWWQLSGGNWEILEQHEKIEDGAVWRAKVQEKLESEAQRRTLKKE